MYEGNAAAVIGKHVGNYVVERTLAQGNMGTVFVARHPALGREVAVKFLGKDLESPPELTERFLDEARIAANLRHPNIVDIFDFGELDGRLYYVMELLDGLDLSDQIREKGRFACDEVIEYLHQICSGLAAAHAIGVVHRDLKPGNIFVLRGEPPRLKLMDFGVAKILSTKGEQTQYGQIIGTPRYMSPEQALGQIDVISPQSDIYSLGIIAYEMLTGKSPFNHAAPMMLLVMHIHEVARPIEDLVPGLPQPLCDLISACLAKDPKNRPDSAQNILDQLAMIRHHSGMRGSMPQLLPLQEPSAPEPASADAETVVPKVTGEPLAATVRDVSTQPVPELVVERTTEDLPETPTSVVHAGAADRAVASDPSVTVASNALPKELTGEPATSPHHDVLSVPSKRRATTVNLTDTDRTTLNRLLSRMQRRGDFPAFVQNVGEVSKRADFEGSFSAEQLGTSILKDYGLTAKLLRIVNATYANRFGGKIYSIRHAIVILGFDRVRSLALSTSVFKNQGNKEHTERVSESSINSLVSGEIARQLISEAELDDPEQATVCAMFRNLGQHLVLVYLPDMYDQIVTLMQQDGLKLNQASERVLGLSMHKLGVGIAERWRLPSKVIAAMSLVAERTGKLRRDEDKLASLAEFSNKLCEIVASDMTADQRATALRALLNRHKNLLQLEPADVDTLLLSTQQAVEKRYASLLGGAARANRFARTVATLSGQHIAEEKGQVVVIIDPGAKTTAPSEKVVPAAQVEQVLLAQPTPVVTSQRMVKQSITGKEQGKPQVALLQLAQHFEPPPGRADGTVASELDVIVARSLAEFGSQGSSEHLLSALLRAVVQHLDVPRIILLRATMNRRELMPVGGIGDDIDGLMKELRLPLTASRVATDPFSLAYHSQRDYFFGDVFAAKVVSSLPQRYFETIGSTSMAILPCSSKGCQSLVMLIDLDPPRKLPASERVAQLARARKAIATIAPNVNF